MPLSEDEITYPYPNLNGCTVELKERISNFTPTLNNRCNYLSMVGLKGIPVCNYLSVMGLKGISIPADVLLPNDGRPLAGAVLNTCFRIRFLVVFGFGTKMSMWLLCFMSNLQYLGNCLSFYTPLHRRWNGGILDSHRCLSVRPSVCRQGFRNFLKKLLAQFVPYLAFALMGWVSWPLFIFVFLASFLALWWPNIWPKMGFLKLFEKKTYWLNSFHTWHLPLWGESLDPYTLSCS